MLRSTATIAKLGFRSHLFTRTLCVSAQQPSSTLCGKHACCACARTIPQTGCALITHTGNQRTANSPLVIAASGFSTAAPQLVHSYKEKTKVNFWRIRLRKDPAEAAKKKVNASLPRNPTLQLNPHVPDQFRDISRTDLDALYAVKPERLAEIAASPSGFVPPAEERPNLPFFVNRSRTNNIPVYVNRKGHSGHVHVTRVRKVQGDIKELERCIRYKLGNDHHYQVNEITSQIKIMGHHKDALVRWFKELGF